MKRNFVLLAILLFFASSHTVMNLFGETPPDPLVPQKLRVPSLAYDERSVVLVWEKPANYAQVKDYNVYMNGRLLGTASGNFAQHAAASKYVENFYAADPEGYHVRIQYHNFTVEKDSDGKPLAPSTEYSFTVRSVLKDGSLSAESNMVTQKTTAVPKIIKVTDFPYNAVGDGTLQSSVEDSSKWDGVTVSAIQKGTDNTKAIQKAIDDCPSGGKVVIPFNPTYKNNTYVTGALYLKSNMTLEIQAGAVLMGSVDPKKYPLSKGYKPNRLSSDDRPPSLLNVQGNNDGKRDTNVNIRIVGKGIVDGSGWASLKPVRDEAGNQLSQFFAGNSSESGSESYNYGGLLAKSQMALIAKGREEADAEGNLRIWPPVSDSADLANAYSSLRSSLATFTNVTGMYVSGVTFRNPAFHGIMFMECVNVVVDGINIQSYDINNGDGLEFGKSEDCMVFNSFIDTGDDCINFACGQGLFASEEFPVDHIWIFNNYTREGHGGVVLGSNTGAWIQNLLAEDNVMQYTDIALRCKSTPPTGGGGRNITFRDSALKAIGGTRPNGNGVGIFVFSLNYSAGTNSFPDAPVPAQFRDFVIRNVTIDNVDKTFKSNKNNAQPIECDGFKGGRAASAVYPEVFNENLLFDNIRLKNVRYSNISRMRNSVFTDVVFTNFQSVNATKNPTPWNIKESKDLKFTGTTSPLPPDVAK